MQSKTIFDAVLTAAQAGREKQAEAYRQKRREHFDELRALAAEAGKKLDRMDWAPHMAEIAAWRAAGLPWIRIAEAMTEKVGREIGDSTVRAVYVNWLKKQEEQSA